MAVYDSGFTFPQLPKTVADAIYSSVPGASFDQRSGFWLIPCQQEVNLTFTIGGQNFPIHPFDTGMLGAADASGNALCQGAVRLLISFLAPYILLLMRSFSILT